MFGQQSGNWTQNLLTEATVCLLVKSNLPFRWHLCVRSSPLYLLASAERPCAPSPPSTEISSLTPASIPHLSLLHFFFFPPRSHPTRLKTNQSKARRAGALGRAAIHQENNKIKMTLLYLIWSFIFFGGAAEGKEQGEGEAVNKTERERRQDGSLMLSLSQVIRSCCCSKVSTLVSCLSSSVPTNGASLSIWYAARMWIYK